MFTFEPKVTQRKTRESLIRTEIRGGERDPKLKENLDTSIHFLNHMIEQWAWRACLNLSVKVEMTNYLLKHVIAEDAGQCFGETLLRVANEMMKSQGINGSGAGMGYIDEACASCRISFEFRSGFHFNKGNVFIQENVEDMICFDLWNFLDGLSQGGRMTLQIDVLSGEDPHHIWESVYRALGEATRVALSPCPWRKGLTPGVAGHIEITHE